MKYLATTLSMPEIIKMLEAIPIIPNSVCLIHLENGETVAIFSSEYDKQAMLKSGKFNLKEMNDNDWYQLQLSGKFSITGNFNLSPMR